MSIALTVQLSLDGTLTGRMSIPKRPVDTLPHRVIIKLLIAIIIVLESLK